MAKLRLRPDGQEIEIGPEIDLLSALKGEGIFVKSSCGGHASCTDCVVKIISGEDNLTPPPFEEIQLLGNVFHITKERLACQTKISGDVTIDISRHDKSKVQSKLKQKTTSMKKVVRRKKDTVGLLKANELEKKNISEEEIEKIEGGLRRVRTKSFKKKK